jgi:glyoxylase-like metal-dependent hydrolase (beta-lactamase superfamily II)
LLPEAAIAKVSNKPIKLIVNTHAHADHFGANEALAKGDAAIVAHDKLRERMTRGFTAFNQAIPPSLPDALPTVTYADAMTLHFNGETIELFHPPNAHTDSDTLVHFKRANVIHASGTIGGDGGYPFFDMGSGGSLAGTIVAQDKMLSLADDNTRIVADEGNPASTETLKASRDMLVTLRARVQKLIDEGKSENEAVASKPTKDFDARWVHQGNFVTGARVSIPQGRHTADNATVGLLRGRQSLRARELAQLVVRRGDFPVCTNRGEGFDQRFRIRDRDPILEDARRRQLDALTHGELVAVRGERVEQRVLANGHGVDDERVLFPMAGGITGERRVVEDSLRRLSAV